MQTETTPTGDQTASTAADASRGGGRAWMPALVGGLAAVGLCGLLLQLTFVGQSQSYDTLLYARSLWGMVHGVFDNPVYEQHALAIHSNLGLYLLAPLTFVMPAAAALIVGQSLAFGATIWLLARHVAPRRRLVAWVSALAVLGTPIFTNAYLFDARPGTLGLPFLVAGMLRCARLGGWDRRAVALMLPALLFREEFALVIAPALVWGWWEDERGAPPGGDMRVSERWLWALGAVGFMALYVLVVRPALGGGDRAAEVAASMTGDGAGSRALWRSRVVVLVATGLSFGGVVWARWRLWPLALPGLGVLMITTRMHEHLLSFHYLLFVAPAVLVGGAEVVRSWAARPPSGARVAAIGILAVASWLAFGAGPGGGRYEDDFFQLSCAMGRCDAADEAVGQARAVLRGLPDDAGVAAPYPLAAPLADRETIWTTDRVLSELRAEGVPESVSIVALESRRWSTVGQRLTAVGGFRFVGGSRDHLAVLARVPAGDVDWSWVEAATCERPVAFWPEAALALCADAPDGQLVFARPPGAPPVGPAFAGRVDAGGELRPVFVGGGLYQLGDLPPGAAIAVADPWPDAPGVVVRGADLRPLTPQLPGGSGAAGDLVVSWPSAEP